MQDTLRAPIPTYEDFEKIIDDDLIIPTDYCKLCGERDPNVIILYTDYSATIIEFPARWFFLILIVKHEFKQDIKNFQNN